MIKEILKVKMLGGFSVHYGGKAIVIDRNPASKTMQLFQIILLNKEKGIAKSALIDALYSRKDVENKNGSLNNTLFRLRKQLRAAGLPESIYVDISGGMCKWTEEIPTEVDCCRFEEVVLAGDICQDVGGQMKYYEEAGLLYDGELLPDMIGEDWAAVKNIYYQKLYFSSQGKLCKWLEKEGKFERLYQVATSASQIYPFEEWQLWRIDSLIAQENYNQAMEVYQETVKKFSEELNLPPSAEMLKRFRIMGEKIAGLPEALDDIQHRLREKNEAEGAYFCTYPSFVDIYHVMGRMMERNGVSVFIMLCTLMYGKNQAAGDSEKDRKAGKFLCEAIRGSLRKGDFYTKYNATQYLVMLSGITQENCPIVSDRIDGKFGCMDSNGYSVQYYVTSIKDADSVVEDERKNFTDIENIWKQ